jgi:alkylresorcinol/alkylpyrone synthase
VTAKLLSLATAVPPYVLERDHVIAETRRIFANYGPEFERLSSVYANSGIDRRYSISPTSWFDTGHDWAEKSDIFLTGASDMFRQVAGKALDQAGLKASDIGTIVSVSSTGIATPSIEAHVLEDMGFQVNVRRVPVFGLGCAGGLSGLSLAARLADAEPGKAVLLVVIELCTLAFRPDEMTKSNIVATALFGDGAAAAVLRSGGSTGLSEIEFSGEHTWPGTTDVMGWRIDPEGFSAIFSRSIPDLTLKEMRPAADGFLARHGLQLSDIDCFSFHPGGVKVIQALETAFELPVGTLANERKILAGFGNMSAPTVLFVLEQALQHPSNGRRFLAALGPGFTVSFVTMVS